MTWRMAILLGALTLAIQSLAQSAPTAQNSPSTNVLRLTVKDAEALALKKQSCDFCRRGSACWPRSR